MADEAPIASGFRGYNKRRAPHTLGPDESPDCQNCRPYNGLIGRLGPRKGRTKLNTTAYASAVVNFYVPFESSALYDDDPMLVAVDDGSSVTISAETAPWAGGAGWGGPTLTTQKRGFYVRWNDVSGPSSGPGASPQNDATGACDVSVNGATKAIATGAGAVFEDDGTIEIQLGFDNAAEVTVNKITASYVNSVLTIDEAVTPIDCTGASKLTSIKVINTEAGFGSVELSGDVYVMGTAATKEDVI